MDLRVTGSLEKLNCASDSISDLRRQIGLLVILKAVTSRYLNPGYSRSTIYLVKNYRRNDRVGRAVQGGADG